MEVYLKNHNYQKAWTKLHQFDKQPNLVKTNMYIIITEIKEGKELEESFQEKNKFCFLFWCSGSDTTKGLDNKIIKLELKTEKIKNKQKDIVNDYQNIVYEQKLTKQKDDSKQEQEILKKEQQAELKQQQILSKQEQKRLEEQKEKELNTQKLLAKQERERLEREKEYELNQQQILAKQEQDRLEREKKELEQSRLYILAQQNPLLKKIMTGEITFWVEPVPYYASSGVSASVEKILDSFESWNGVKRVYNENSADIRIQWIKEFSPHQGGQYWQSQVQVGLGQTGCKGEWQPFVSHTVRQILWHEIGHAMGHSHSNDQNNIMMGNGLKKYFDTELDDDVFLEDGGFSWRSFCQGGQYTFDLKSSSKSSGFVFYVITPETNAKQFLLNNEGKHYPNCRDEGKWVSHGLTCNVSKGSYLLIYNPRDDGKAINVDITTKYTGAKKVYDMQWDPNSLKDTQWYSQYLDSLR